MAEQNILIIAPHADDEILGCGGMISKFAKTKDIYILILTNASKSNSEKFTQLDIKKIRKEALLSHKYAGIKKTFFEEFPAPMLDQYPIYLISDSIYEYIKKINPIEIFLPFYGDTHIDHRIIYDAAMVAVRPFLGNRIKSIYCYETLSETDFGIQRKDYSFVPNHFISLNQKQVNHKINMFKFFKSQIKKYPHPRSLKGIEIQAQYRGIMSNSNYSEAYIIVRDYD